MNISYLFKIFLVCILTNASQSELTLKINIANQIVNKKEDLSIRLELNNLTSKPLLIHKHTQFGYVTFCYDDFCFTVEKKVRNHYDKMEELAAIDRFGAYDSLGVSWDDIYDTLAVGKTRREEFNIIGYYRLTKGKYRTKFKFNVPKTNNLSIKNIDSDWIYFEVKSNNVEYMQ
ncbi:MAG: hypothetical protein ABIN67_23285 [Ferruginibacter sp.]